MELLQRTITCAILLCTMMHLASADLYEGSNCRQKNGTAGICRTIKSCKWVKEHRIPPQSFVTCSFIGNEALICCSDEVITPHTHRNQTVANEGDFVFRNPNGNKNSTKVPATSTTTTTTTTTTVRPLVITLPTMDKMTESDERKSQKACDLFNEEANKVNLFPDEHILNGVSADPGEFPHIAAIGYKNPLIENDVTYDCGGSLISKTWILTAAHCVNKRNRQPSVVRLGKLTLLNDEDELTAQDIAIKNITIHPLYTARQKYNDIALIELQNPITFNKFVNPACLSAEPDNSVQKLTICGYGVSNTTTKSKSNVLLKAQVNAMNIEDCTKYFEDFSWYTDELPKGIVKSQLCAIDLENNSDTCQGDSGGPIQYDEIVKAERREYIVGLTSFGVHCGSQLPSMYTRVSEYLDWIEEKVWPGAVSLDS